MDPEKQEIQLSNTPCVITAIGENIDNGEMLYKLKIKDKKKILVDWSISKYASMITESYAKMTINNN